MVGDADTQSSRSTAGVHKLVTPIAEDELQPVHEVDTSAEPSPHLNARILRSLVHYLGDYYGRNVVRELGVQSGLDEKALAGSTQWISIEQFASFIEAARALMASDDEFLKACGYELREGYGPMVLMLRTMSLRTFWELFARTMQFVSKVSRYAIEKSERTSVVLRYESDFREPRLMCLSRIAQLRGLPTLWDLPEATVVEHACMARGDDHCQYHLQWHDQPRWMVSLLGAGLGGVGAFLLSFLSIASIPPLAMLPLLGAAVGYAAELRRTNRANLKFSEETNQEMRSLAVANTEAMEEILALNSRQLEWSRHLEEQVTERTSVVRELYDRLRRLGEKRETVLRSFSHDLRNPLTVLKATEMELRTLLDRANPETAQLLRDISQSINELDRLVRELMNFATESTRTDLVRLTAVTLEIQPLVERLRRRLRALVLGREVRVSVFRTREAPDVIETDALLFDRVIDNLLTNAAKYTDFGSVVLELTGRPGMLTVKVSDTGPGISEERIEGVFRAHEAGKRPGVTDSYGMGLSIVVRLLDQVGGRLEVMSKPGVGTTFWAHFPVELPKQEGAERLPLEETLDDIVGRVVTVRRVLSG